MTKKRGDPKTFGPQFPVKCPTCGHAGMATTVVVAQTKPDTTHIDCPHCGHDFDIGKGGVIAFTVSPKPGDVSWCRKCGEVLVRDEQLETKVADLNALMRLAPESRELLGQMQKITRKMRSRGVLAALVSFQVLPLLMDRFDHLLRS